MYSINKSTTANSWPTPSESDLVVYPNPFNESVNIAFSIEEDEQVMISVYNIHGEVVQVIHDGNLPEGDYTMRWDGKTENGNTTPTGIYIVRIVTGHTVNQKTLVRTR